MIPWRAKHGYAANAPEEPRRKRVRPVEQRIQEATRITVHNPAWLGVIREGYGYEEISPAGFPVFRRAHMDLAVTVTETHGIGGRARSVAYLQTAVPSSLYDRALPIGARLLVKTEVLRFPAFETGEKSK